MDKYMPNIIAITNQKGGVGKTTTAGALVIGLALKGKKVLCIDLDPQGSLGFSLGVNIEDCVTIHEVLKGRVTAAEAVIHLEHCDMIPSNILLSSAELDFNRTGREFLLKNSLMPILDQYDYVIIDTPPALNVLTINAYSLATSLMIPMIPDILSLLGISQLNETIDAVTRYYNPNLSVFGILLTKYNGRTKLAQEVREMAKQIAVQLKTKVIDVSIRNNVAVAEAPAHGECVLTYAPTANAALDYMELVEAVLAQEK